MIGPKGWWLTDRGYFENPAYYQGVEKYVSKLGNFYRNCGRACYFASHHTKKNVLSRQQILSEEMLWRLDFTAANLSCLIF